MKTKKLLFLCALTVSTMLSATTITVTNNASSGDGSFLAATVSAVDGDAINFNFDGTEISLTDVIAMKSITINGLNAFNNKKMILKQATVTKNYFTLATGITVSLQNLVFDGLSTAASIAITAVNGSTLNIQNCVFKNINSGLNNGAVARIQGVANINNTLFENNICAGSYGGGALCIYNAADVTIDKCSFTGNISNINGANKTGGGAIVARGTVTTGPCNVKITNSTFANNKSQMAGGAILAGVISSSDCVVNVTAVNCSFTGNQGDGAVSAFTTVKGKANVYLVNSIVVNNVNAAADSYSDILETKGTDAATVAMVEPHNIIYSVAPTIVTTDRNCVQVADPSTANIFNALETFATDKKRPVLSTSNGQTVAMISSTSIAKTAGVVALSPYTIPTVDQLSETRPATPAIGAVEFKDLGTGFSNLKNEDKIQLISKEREISFSGLSENSEVRIYGLTGNLLLKSVVRNNQTISLQNIRENLVLLKIGSQSFKLLLK